MKKWQLLLVTLFGTLMIVALVGLAVVTRSQAHILLTQPQEARNLPDKTPANLQLPYQDVIVTTTDGLHLVGWYLPSHNGALIITQHGYKNTREEMLNEAEMLSRHGYGVLISSVCAHDKSDGEQISFGYREMQDLEAWYQYALTRTDVQPERIDVLGNSIQDNLCIATANNPHVG